LWFKTFSQLNGVNLLQLSAKDAYAYGRSLLDALFSKEELAKSLVYKSKKSNGEATTHYYQSNVVETFAIACRKTHKNFCPLVDSLDS